MGKRRKQRRHGGAYEPDMYWQSSAYNSRLFRFYKQQIIKLALNRFKWVNLPETCDERYLEMILLYQGAATIAFPKKQVGTFYSTQVTQMSPPNVYDNPTRWISVGNSGWRFRCNAKNGVMVWDNRPRVPLIDMIELWAQELVDIRRTKQINRLHVKTPYVVRTPPEMEQQALNIFKQISGGEPAIVTTDGLSAIQIDVIDTKVEFLGEELTAEEMNTWAMIYQSLGIQNLTFKAERMVQDEVNKRDEPSDLIALDGLNCRRDACEKLNERFGQYLDAPINCVWAKDNDSDNFNLMSNLKEMVELDGSTGTSSSDESSEDSDEETEQENERD